MLDLQAQLLPTVTSTLPEKLQKTTDHVHTNLSRLCTESMWQKCDLVYGDEIWDES